jgi:signal transduction histidine kinase
MFFARLSRFSKTVGFKLTAWSAAVFAVSSLVLFILTYLLLSSSLKEKDRQAIQLKLKSYAEVYEAGGLPAFTHRVETERNSGELHNQILKFTDRGQATLAFVPPDDGSQYDLRPLATANGNPSSWLQLHAVGEDDVLDVASLRLPDGSVLQVGASPENREDVLDRFRNNFVFAFVAVLALAIAGGMFVSTRALYPVRGLIAALQPLLVTDKLKARVPVQPTGDEIEHLSLLLNQALAKIDRLVEGMRNSLDNVAHDLRTPLTRLRGIAEGALSRPADVHSYREALSDALEESGNILLTLNTLMEISEVEANSTRLDLAQVDLHKLVHQVLDMYHIVAEERSISLTAVCPSGLSLFADRRRLIQAISNLVDNAVKYTPNNGRVEVEAHSALNEIVLSVRDTGIGISPGEAEKIWDRSYRGDASRAQRGLGLGLSLAKAVVQAHNGRVAMSSEPGSGSSFTLFLPAGSA